MSDTPSITTMASMPAAPSSSVNSVRSPSLNLGTHGRAGGAHDGMHSVLFFYAREEQRAAETRRAGTVGLVRSRSSYGSQLPRCTCEGGG